MIKEGHLGDLVNEDGKFPHDLTSQMKYKKFVAAMYFKLYCVEIKSLGLDWASFVSEDFINLQRLREVGIKKFKGNAFMYVPVQGVLSATFKRTMYQVLEYDQIFHKVPEYPDPLEYGFKEIGEGIVSLVISMIYTLIISMINTYYVLYKEQSSLIFFALLLCYFRRNLS